MKRRRPESHVYERDENNKLLDQFHRVAEKQNKRSDEMIEELEHLHRQYDAYVKQYKELFDRHRHDQRHRDMMNTNRYRRQQILKTIEHNTHVLEIVEADYQYNLDKADELLNHMNGYSTSPAAFVGLGPYMDDEPNPEYGLELTAEAIEYLSNQS